MTPEKDNAATMEKFLRTSMVRNSN